MIHHLGLGDSDGAGILGRSSGQGDRFGPSARVRDLVLCWNMTPLVETLQAMRGVSLIVASAPVAAFGDFRRFDNQR